MYQDTPMYQIGWDFEKLIFGNQPLGWDQVGKKEVINGVKQADFLKYRSELYTPDNTVIAVAGNIDHEDVVKRIEALFQFKAGSKAYAFDAVKDLKLDGKLTLRTKKTEQAHVMLGFPSFSEQDPSFYAEKLLAIVLGGNMSSRMFLSVRERQGLAYYINTSTDDYTDIGTFSTNAGVSLDGIEKAITAIIGEYQKVLEEPVPERELTKAKEFLKGKMVLRLEDSEEYAHLLGKFELLYGSARTPEDIIAMVEKVTSDDLTRVARALFKEDRLRLAVIGPYEEEEKFLKLLKF